MMNYYNEFDPKAAAALRQLIADKLIPYGDVDDRSITEVRPEDLKGYTQCHFFAGIAGWSLALQLAGWPTDRPVWTGSCPCQPFSTAGKQKGKEDERHLWPVWFRLIRESRPPVVFGEQVSAAIRHGWWDEVADDLDGEGYTCRAEIRPACSVGAPHKRDRLWFVANSGGEQCVKQGNTGGCEKKTRATGGDNTHCRDVAHSESARSGGAERSGSETSGRSTTRNGVQFGRTNDECSNAAYSKGVLLQGCKGRPGEIKPWGNSQLIQCPDGKQRLIEPSIPLLVNGVPERVALLRAAGNAIVPQVAATFIKSYMERE